MSENNFFVNDKDQKEIRDRFLVPFYNKFAQKGQYVFIDKSSCSMHIQKQIKIDTIVLSQKGGTVCIEEKIATWPQYKNKPHTAFFLETDSCTNPGHLSPGWMKNGMADYLLYCFVTRMSNLDIYLLNFPELKKWFWRVWKNYPEHTMKEQNRTRGRLADILEVVNNINCSRYYVTETEINKLAPTNDINTIENIYNFPIASAR